jgi:hypothetical protein
MEMKPVNRHFNIETFLLLQKDRLISLFIDPVCVTECLRQSGRGEYRAWKLGRREQFERMS